LSPKASDVAVPPWHPVYFFFGIDVDFVPHWQKPAAACPGVYLDHTQLTAIVAAAQAAAADAVQADPPPASY